MQRANIPTINLSQSKDRQISVLGLGTWELVGDDCYQSVQQALDIGYQHIDTAQAYGNHQVIGRALKEYPLYRGQAIPENQKGIYRENLFITSKLWIDSFNSQQVLDSGQKALDEIGLEYLDLYLLHWPNRSVPIEETLEAMQHLQRQNKIKSIGVSNFTIHHLQDALKTGVEIVMNQVEYHPSLQQKELLDFCRDHGIALTAYSPLGRGEDLQIPEIQQIAQKHQVSPARVIISWLISQNIIVIPKASKKEHLQDSFEAINLYLDKEELEVINGLGRGNRIVSPSFADFDY
jgi:2,5-diketo-D-gluconate reductase B